MRIVNRISLRMRITLLSGIILLISSVILSVGAAYNAHSQFEVITLGNYSLTEAGKLSDKQTEWNTNGILNYPSATTAPALTQAKKQFDTVNIMILAVVSILGMGMVYIVAGRSLRPIRNLSKTIAVISEDNLQERIPEENRNDEVGMLGHSFNIMLDRLEGSFLRQKRFSANVAHELKTPIATINAGIQVLNLEKEPTIAEYREALETTARNVNRLRAIVDNLMNLFEEQIELSITSVDLQEIFTSIIHELRPILDQKKIATDFRCGLKNVYGNQVLLYRALFNLVENAVKYNKEGGKISIETKEENGVGQIIIADTGHGIPADELQQIFEPFYRVNKSRSRKTGGAGLGLSIVKAVIEKHGWEITVISELEQGSTFTITFAA